MYCASVELDCVRSVSSRRRSVGFIVDGAESGEGGRGRIARKDGGHTSDLLLGLVRRIPTDELVLFKLNDDIGACTDGGDVEAASLDELHMELTARDARGSIGGGRRRRDGSSS